jgi:hypothetical protein
MSISRVFDRHWRRDGYRMAAPAGTPTAYLSMLLLSLLLVACGGGGGPGTLHSVGGTISGLDGTVILQNSGGDNLSRSANGTFAFTTRLPTGSTYAITVLTQPATQSCLVTNGAGTIATDNVTNVSIVCQNSGSGATNANLSSLTLSNGTVDPVFAASQVSYTSIQPFPVTSLQVTPVTENAGATVTVNGSAVISGQASAPITLAAGTNTVITIVVTAANGTTIRTYTVTVTRQSLSGFAQQAYIKASNPDGVATNTSGAGDQFGYATALSGNGDTLAVGAIYESSNATGINGVQTNNLASESGAVYIFTRIGAAWTQQAYVKASNAAAGDKFGVSLSLSSDGNTLAVGAFNEDSAATGVNGDQSSNSATNAGAAYVFTRSGTTWTQQAYIKASNTGATFDELDQFGYAVGLSGNGDTLAVGAPGEGSNATGINGNQANNSAAFSGAVYVFTRSSGAWTQQAYVKSSNTAASDSFGERVGLSSDGDTLAVGAVGEDSNATGINGDQASNSASASGAVYVFTRSSGVWSQQAYVKASNTGANDEFATDIALSSDGNTLAVGAVGEDSNATGINGDQASNAASASGAAFVFTRSSGVWSQQAYLKASNTGASDEFGWSVALSDDGNRLAIAATEEDGNATGMNGDQASNSAANSGAVYVFARSGGIWTQRAYAKASNTEANDGFGISLALSGDADTLVVAADGEDSNAVGINGDQANNALSSSGAAYVFAGVASD